MKDLRIWVKNARSIILEDSAAQTLDFLYARYQEADEVFRRIEMILAETPFEVGIRGICSDDFGLEFYLHVSERMPPISVLYRHDEENVYVESLALEGQVSYGLAS